MFWSIVAGVVKLLASFAEYVQNKQLIDAGKAEQQIEQAKIAEKAKDDLHDIQVSISIADDAKRQQLRDKWTARDD